MTGSPPSYLRDAALPALERGAARQGRARPKLIAHAFLALTSAPAELQQGVDEFLPVYPRLTNYQEMFAAAGYPEARQGAWSTGMVDAVVLHGTDDQCSKKLESFMRTLVVRRSSCPSCCRRRSRCRLATSPAMVGAAELVRCLDRSVSNRGYRHAICKS